MVHSVSGRALALRWVLGLGLAACGSAEPEHPPPPPATAPEVTSAPPRPLAPLEAPHLLFRDITAWAGLDFAGNSLGTGASFIELDGDGDDDLVIPMGSRTAVMRNRGDGSFERVQTLDLSPPLAFSYAIELTGDGLDDVLFITLEGPETWASEAGQLTRAWDLLFLKDASIQPAAASFGDFGGTGQHDIFLGRAFFQDPDGAPGAGEQQEIPAPDSLYRRAGDDYEDVTGAMGIEVATNTFCAMTVDLNGDGRLDLLVGTQHDVPDSYYLMGEDGRFVESGDALGIRDPTLPGVGDTSAMGFDAADVDHDGDLDLYLTDDNPTWGDRLYLQESPGRFRYANEEAGLGDTREGVGWGVGLHDFDHDGDIDLFVANGLMVFGGSVPVAQENFYFTGLGDGRFERVTAPPGSGLEALEQSIGAAFSDIDADGDLDVLVQNTSASPTLLRNEQGSGGHWLALRLRHPTLSPVVGAIVTLRAEGKLLKRWVHGTPSYGGSSTHLVHFGLGDATVAEDVEVRWPDGTAQAVGSLTADAVHVIGTP